MTEITVVSLTADLQTVFNQAQKSGDASTMVGASMATARLHGLIIEKRVVEYASPEAAQVARHRAAVRELRRRLRLKVA